MRPVNRNRRLIRHDRRVSLGHGRRVVTLTPAAGRSPSARCRRDRASRRSGCAAARSSPCSARSDCERRARRRRRRAPARPHSMAISASVSGSKPASLSGTGTVIAWRASPAKGRKKPAGSLRRAACRRSGRAGADRGPRSRRRPARSPIAGRRDCARRRARCRSPAAPASTSGPDFSRCMRAGQSALARPASIAAGGEPDAGAPERGDREAGIVHLMRAEQAAAAAGRAARPRPGRRAVRARRRPCSPRRGGRAARRRPSPRASIIASACSSCGADDAGRAALQDAGLLRRDAGEVGAEELGVVVADRGDHRGERPVDDVGGVEAAAEPDLEQAEIGRDASA